MLRVKIIHFLRRFSSPLAIETILFMSFTTAISFMVSVKSVVHNISLLGSTTEGFGYVYHATLDTTLSVQLILCGTLLLGLIITRNFYRNLRMAV